ncbi:hypothetical protein AwDysgo_08280 [Bacteroidales bacterium]|nr:hypothetical protein AwDysgo_08280 [Bacteroidales bacterium]
MKYIEIITLAFVLGFLAPKSLVAQESARKDSSLSRELILEKEYNLSVRDVSKISYLPEIKEPEATKANVEFSNFTIPYELQPSLNILQPADYLTALVSSKKRGYAHLAVGSFVDIDADLGLSLINTSSSSLNMWGMHRSSNGNVKYLQDDEKQKMRQYVSSLGLAFNKELSLLRFFVDAKYTFAAFNYYGFTPSVNSFTSIPLSDRSILKGKNQINNIFDLDLGLSSKGINDINYSADFTYAYFTQKHSGIKEQEAIAWKYFEGAKENILKFKGDINKALANEKRIGLGFDFRNTAYSLPTAIKDSFNSYENYGVFAVNPYFIMEGDQWDTRLGLRASILINQVDKVSFAPDLAFNFRPKENILMYLLAQGEVKDNSNRRMYDENRYVSPLYRVLDADTRLEASLGIKSSVLKRFWFDVYTSYSYTKGEHFFVSSYSKSSDLDLNVAVFEPCYATAKTWTLGTNMKYSLNKIFDLELRAKYAKWTVDANETNSFNNGIIEAWYKPSFESDINLSYSFLPAPIKLNLIYHLETGLKAFEASLKDIHQVNMQASYTLNDNFSFYLKGNNLLFQRYELWYAYPAHNFNVMAGINIKF